jgi:hypothetical protein
MEILANVLWGLFTTAAFAYFAYLGYQVGFSKGFRQGELTERAKHVQAPSRFRQRTAEAKPGRFARISRARVMARRQRTPNPRRGNPGNS